MKFFVQGGEPFHPVTAKADRSNGYVKGNKGMADVQPKASEMVSTCNYYDCLFLESQILCIYNIYIYNSTIKYFEFFILWKMARTASQHNNLL